MAIYPYSNWFLIPGEMGGSDCSTAGRKPPLGKCWFRWTSHLCSDRFTPSGQWSVLTAGRTCHKIQLWQLNGLQGEPCISVPNSSDELIFVKKSACILHNVYRCTAQKHDSQSSPNPEDFIPNVNFCKFKLTGIRLIPFKTCNCSQDTRLYRYIRSVTLK